MYIYIHLYMYAYIYIYMKICMGPCEYKSINLYINLFLV